MTDLRSLVAERFPHLLSDARTFARYGRIIPPCASCGDEGGRPANARSRAPYRTDGARFGVDGPICATCRQRFVMRARRRGAGR